MFVGVRRLYIDLELTASAVCRRRRVQVLVRTRQENQ